MKSNYNNIYVQTDNHIATLNFNRPDQLNAMNREMMDEIIEAIESINEDKEIRVAIIRGKGRAFMAGADIKEYASQTREQFKAFQERGKTLYASIENASIPWIAAVDGYALGGGFEIALACDIILASEVAKMGLPEVFLNLVPGGGGTQRLVQKIGINRVKEMLFTGDQYDAITLLDWGIVNQVFKADTFDDKVMDYAKKLYRRPAASIKYLKRLAQVSLSATSFDQKIEEERKAVIDLFYSEEAQKAIQKFMDKSNK